MANFTCTLREPRKVDTRLHHVEFTCSLRDLYVPESTDQLGHHSFTRPLRKKDDEHHTAAGRGSGVGRDARGNWGAWGPR